MHAYGILVGKSALRRSRCRLEDNIKMDFREKECDINWICLAQDRDWSKSLLKNLPYDDGKFLSS
jgi:hypothetical protein